MGETTTSAPGSSSLRIPGSSDRDRGLVRLRQLFGQQAGAFQALRADVHQAKFLRDPIRNHIPDQPQREFRALRADQNKGSDFRHTVHSITRINSFRAAS